MKFTGNKPSAIGRYDRRKLPFVDVVETYLVKNIWSLLAYPLVSNLVSEIFIYDSI